MHDMHTDVAILQQEDLVMFGALILQLAAGSFTPIHNITKAAEILGRHYSADLKNVALYLTMPQSHPRVCRLTSLSHAVVLIETTEHQAALRHDRQPSTYRI